jgi:haloalkane dehalogenase
MGMETGTIMPGDEPTVERFVESGNWTPVSGADLFWVEAGSSAGSPPVLFLHGIPTWSWLWREVVPITGSDRRSIAVDLPGFGRSSRTENLDFRVTALAESIEQFLDEEVGPGEPVSLVAHDFGALVCCELLCRSPDRFPELVITNTSLRPESWTEGGYLRILSVPYLAELAMWLAKPWMLRLAMRPFVADPGGRAGHRFEGYWYPFDHGFGRALARLFQQKAVVTEDFDRWRTALTEYEGRALIAWGARDPAFTISEMADLFSLASRAETIIFPSASHFLPEDAPQSLGRRIRAFLAGVKVDQD